MGFDMRHRKLFLTYRMPGSGKWMVTNGTTNISKSDRNGSLHFCYEIVALRCKSDRNKGPYSREVVPLVQFGLESEINVQKSGPYARTISTQLLVRRHGQMRPSKLGRSFCSRKNETNQKELENPLCPRIPAPFAMRILWATGKKGFGLPIGHRFISWSFDQETKTLTTRFRTRRVMSG